MEWNDNWPSSLNSSTCRNLKSFFLLKEVHSITILNCLWMKGTLSAGYMVVSLKTCCSYMKRGIREWVCYDSMNLPPSIASSLHSPFLTCISVTSATEGKKVMIISYSSLSSVISFINTLTPLQLTGLNILPSSSILATLIGLKLSLELRFCATFCLKNAFSLVTKVSSNFLTSYLQLWCIFFCCSRACCFMCCLLVPK